MLDKGRLNIWYCFEVSVGLLYLFIIYDLGIIYFNFIFNDKFFEIFFKLFLLFDLCKKYKIFFIGCFFLKGSEVFNYM